jgi:uncharacterized membrane protein YkvA (DUF1232 family)
MPCRPWRKVATATLLRAMPSRHLRGKVAKPRHLRHRLSGTRDGAISLPMTRQDLIPYSPEAQEPQTLERNQTRVQRGFWDKLKRSVGRVPFLEEAVSAYFCAFDPQTPRSVKAMLLAALAYFVVPTDMVPDFIAGLGFTDDATVLYATLRLVAGNIGERHREQARQRLQQLGLRDTPSPGAVSPPAPQSTPGTAPGAGEGG